MLKFNRPPYADTSVNADKTQQDITALLRKYGIGIILLDKRINYIHKAKKTGAFFASAWFCWRIELPGQITFEEVVP